MGEILLYALLFLTCGAALLQPWIGVLAGYLFILLAPQHIWWWHFSDVRAFHLIALATIVGTAIALLTNRVGFKPLRSKLNFFLLIWWAAVAVSYYFGPYVDAPSQWRFFDPTSVLDIVNKAFLFYFIALLCMDNDRKFGYLVYVGIFSVAYLVYWTNMQYLGGSYGRLGGPRSLTGGLYADQNMFAMFLVVMLPFIYYAGLAVRRLPVRYGLWLIIPFGWHAIFLTGSRGGLVGLAATLLLMSLRSAHKGAAVLLIPAFVGAYLWQGGPIMKERAQTITEYEADNSAQTRFQAWNAASGMILAHPLTGVGVASFGPAFPDFSERHPRAAHNTFLQVSAESGLAAGIAWLMIMGTALLALWRRLAPPPEPGAGYDERLVYYMNDALLVALSGFGVCSLFLSLQTFEAFFYLILLTNYLFYRRAPDHHHERASGSPLPTTKRL